MVSQWKHVHNNITSLTMDYVFSSFADNYKIMEIGQII